MHNCWSCTCCFSEPLAHCQNVAKLSFFYRDYLFHFLILKVGLLVILIDCMIFLSPFPDVLQGCLCQNFPSSHSFTLIFSLPTECFFSTYDLNDFNCRINRHLLTASFFYRDFLYVLAFLCFFFL